ncbi:MAG TPA: multicopper oxidase domain-containing protein [Nitrospiraceae bacterium]|nr:multicopper oxidase domain-containing protein [Nitrospiraceae bacterium]
MLFAYKRVGDWLWFVITLSIMGFGTMTLSVGPALAKTHEVEMTAVESELVVDGGGMRYKAWTFNGQFPGPVVRVTEGDVVKFTLHNPKTNVYPHAMDFHAAEIDFLKNYRAINAGESISYTFVARKPGIFFYHCGAPPMIQHVARGMIGAIIVDPKNSKAWPKADREYVLVQSELFKNPDDVQAMFDRKFDYIVFNGGIFKYHPFVTGGKALEAKPGERVRIYFVNAGPNEFSAFHPIGEIWDAVYESGNPANKHVGVQTYVVGPGSAATFDVIVESAGAYPLVTHSLTGALRGAIAVLVASPDAKPGPLMPHTPWKVDIPQTEITPTPAP